MAKITADSEFRLVMDDSGNIGELNSYWTKFAAASTSGTFSARLIKKGPYFTTYTIVFGDEVVSDVSSTASGGVQTLSLYATSLSRFGQTGLQLAIEDADIAIEHASRLPLSLFVSGDDVITGSLRDDVLHGVTGNDWLDGRRGKDYLYGDAGDDTLVGGSRDADRLYGGIGDDTFIISDARHVVIESAGAGNDRLYAHVSYVLKAWSEVEILQAADSAKAINLTGSEFANAIYGNDGRNSLYGRGGDDTIAGGDGNDIIEGGTGADQLFGQEGHDQLSYAHSREAVIVNLGDNQGYAGDALGDWIEGFEAVLGSKHSDRIEGDEAANHLFGEGGHDLLVGAGGDDVLIGGRGNDSLIGGDGYDQLDYSRDAARRGVSVDLTTGTARDGFGGLDAISNFEDVRGTKFKDLIVGSDLSETLRGEGGNDRLIGNGGDDALLGGAGNDFLSGGNGNDRLVAGSGNDTLTGGAGHDIFVFNSKPNRRTNVDKITDFNPGEDLFHLDKVYLKNIGWFDRPLKDDFFHLGKKAEDKFNRIIYDQETGSLYYDQDGTGSAAQIKIAVLSNKASIDWSHFFVV